jgi:PAS domain-containing protein
MALGENIKRERMIPIRNKIMYRNLEEELAEMKEKEFDFSETSFFSNDEIAVSLQQLNYFEEESQTKTSFQTEEHHPALDFILQSMLITADIGIDEKILTANSLFCRALNLENLEIGIRYFKEFILKEKLSDWALHWEKVQKGEPIQEIIELQPRNTEEKVILAATLYPVHQQGILQKVVLMAQDITKAINAYKNNTTIELDIDKNLKSAKIIVKI